MLRTRLAEHEQRRLGREERREVGSGDGLRLEALVRQEPGRSQLLTAPVQSGPPGHATARPSARARISSGWAASSRCALGNGDGGDHRVVLVRVPPEDLVHPPELLPRRVDPIEDDEEVDVRLRMRVPSGPRAEQQDPTQARAVERTDVLGHRLHDLDRIEPRGELWELRVPSRLELPVGHASLDQSLVHQPLDDPTSHADVMERKPCLTQLREVQKGVLEPPEGSPPGDGPLEQAPGSRVPHPADEVLHVPVRLAGQDRLDTDQATFLRMVTLPDADGVRIEVWLGVTGSRIEPPACLRGVVLQRFGQRPKAHPLQIEHRYLLHPLDGNAMVVQPHVAASPGIRSVSGQRLAGSRSSARWRAWRPARWSSWVRQENPSARTTASGPAARTAGRRAVSATATETS